MDLRKSYEFIQPEKVSETIHIIGLGTIGSRIAEFLARSGFTKFELWDLDKVERKNINNQCYTEAHVGKPKTEACKDLILSINPEAEQTIKLHDEGWTDEILSGYVFLAVDNIDIRRAFVEQHINNPFIKVVFDCRVGLTDGQFYAADWSNYKSRQKLLKTMDFTHEEAMESTPVSACGGVLGVVTTAAIMAGNVVNNFINFVKGNQFHEWGYQDAFSFDITVA